MIVDDRTALACIHCGFCLPSCPTYAVRGDEADSPRGRIWFIREMQAGRLEPSAQVATHLDRCLACFACETACPSGVHYRELIEDARDWMLHAASPVTGEPAAPAAGAVRGSALWRGFFASILPNPQATRLSLLPFWLAERLGLRTPLEFVASRVGPGWTRRAVALLPDRIPAPIASEMPETLPAKGEKRMRVGYLLGCVMEGMVPRINRLQIEILRHLGCEVVCPKRAGCCGSLALHEGEKSQAEYLGRDAVGKFEHAHVDVVVASAAGCGSTMKDWGKLLPGTPGAQEIAAKVRDFTEVVAELIKDRPPKIVVDRVVAYQEACHLGHAQKVKDQPRAILKAIPGLTIRELPEQELCCGSAGVYNLVEPELAGKLGERKAEHAKAAHVDAVVTANPGCLFQLNAHLKQDPASPKLLHLAELLAESYGIRI